jgi:hypothetical protein
MGWRLSGTHFESCIDWGREGQAGFSAPFSWAG